MVRPGGMFTLAFLLGWAILGCNSKYDVVSVKGKVTYDGQPVPDMIVRFEPVVGRPSDSFTAADGSFDMSYTLDRMGVEVDSHKVTVIWASPTDAPGAKPTEIQKKVLANFKEKGPIEVKIEKPQPNFEIKLPR
jgi:hypothetical protein